MNELIPVAGLGVGFLYGVFGIGSAFATPVLALLGVSGLAAVVAPLPALLPSSCVGAWSYVRNGNVDRLVARRIIAAGLPAAVAGAVVSHQVDGNVLLILSGLVLLLAGLRVLLSHDRADHRAAALRRRSLPLVIVAGGTIGFASGLLANGGGFLLVPLFIVVLGLEIPMAIGTSLWVASLLTIPTLGTHILMGGIDWSVSGLFTLGLVPGALAGGLVAQQVPADRMRWVLGAFLVAFASWFLANQLGLFS